MFAKLLTKSLFAVGYLAREKFVTWKAIKL